MSLSEEQRREMIRNAGEPKKGYHWAIWFDWNNGGEPTLTEWRTQFRSADGKLVAHRVSRVSYTIIDRETSYVVASAPGRTYARGLVEELGPKWAETVAGVFHGDVDAVDYVKATARKHKSILR